MSTSTVQAPFVEGPSAEDSKLARRLSRRQGLFAPDLLWAAFKQSFVMLRPDIQWKNPVMFVVEVGTVLSIIFTIATILGAGGQATLSYLIALDVWLFLTVLFANFASALAEARGKVASRRPAQNAARNPGLSPADQTARSKKPFRPTLQAGDLVVVEAGQFIPGDGEIVEGVAVGRRIGHHRRIGPGHPRSGRRSLGRDRRHARAFRPHRRRNHRHGRQIVSRSDDRAGRRGHSPADAQRNRPVAGARRLHVDLPDRHRRAVADGAERRNLHDRFCQ